MSCPAQLVLISNWPSKYKDRMALVSSQTPTTWCQLLSWITFVDAAKNSVYSKGPNVEMENSSAPATPEEVSRVNWYLPSAWIATMVPNAGRPCVLIQASTEKSVAFVFARS